MAQTKISGFTLIEMLIVITLIAILAKVSIAAYTNYLYKGKVQELVEYAQSQSGLISDYLAKNPLITALRSTTCTSIVTTTAISTSVTNQYGINSNCQGYANSVANAFGTGVTLTAYISPVMGLDGTLSWVCSVVDNTGTISKYAPATCITAVPTYP
jgi:prepilin-type N-terminal cleavage/methylation domain-containing protein